MRIVRDEESAPSPFDEFCVKLRKGGTPCRAHRIDPMHTGISGGNLAGRRTKTGGAADNSLLIHRHHTILNDTVTRVAFEIDNVELRDHYLARLPCPPLTKSEKCLFTYRQLRSSSPLYGSIPD